MAHGWRTLTWRYAFLGLNLWRIMEYFKKWNVKYGGASKEDLLIDLAKKKINLNAYASLIFLNSGFKTSELPKSCIAVEVTPLDLGINVKATYDEIVNEALLKGFKLCPLELAVALRVHYQEQPEGPLITVASEVKSWDDTVPNGFYLRKFNNNLWLRGYTCSKDWLWEPESKFVFIESNA